MMWNFLVGGLLVGATIVLFDGSPGHPDLGALWRLAEQAPGDVLRHLGARSSRPALQGGPAAPGRAATCRALRASAPPARRCRWRASGGSATRSASRSRSARSPAAPTSAAAFVGVGPDVPVWLGEISCPAAGRGRRRLRRGTASEVVEEVGELVITQPMPSMPVMFWNDPDGSRLREAYFEDYPGVWRHGDWVARHRPRLVRDLRPPRRDPQPRRRPDGHRGLLRRRRGLRRGGRLAGRGHDALGAAEEGELLCFLVLAAGASLERRGARLRGRCGPSCRRGTCRTGSWSSTPIPRTLNGKKCEVPVKKILAGVAADKAVSPGRCRTPTPWPRSSTSRPGGS